MSVSPMMVGNRRRRSGGKYIMMPRPTEFVRRVRRLKRMEKRMSVFAVLKTDRQSVVTATREVGVSCILPLMSQRFFRTHQDWISTCTNRRELVLTTCSSHPLALLCFWLPGTISKVCNLAKWRELRRCSNVHADNWEP